MPRAPAAIFTPLPGNDPIGLNMQQDVAFDRLRDLLDSDQTSKWQSIQAICIDILSHQSKDFYIFAHLANAVAFGSVDNLVEGLDIYFHALEKYWGTAHPKDGMHKIMTWLDIALKKQCLKYLVMSETSASQLYTMTIRKQPLPESAEYNYYLEQLPQALNLCGQINLFVQSKDPAMPILTETVKFLQWLMELPRPIATEAQSSRVSSMSRKKAYEMIEEAANFLNKSEPHNLTSLVLIAVHKWQERSLLEIINELKEVHPDGLNMILRWVGEEEE